MVESVQQTGELSGVLPVVEARFSSEEVPKFSLKARLFVIFIFLLIGLGFSRLVRLPPALFYVSATIFSLFFIKEACGEVSEKQVRGAIKRLKQIASALPCLASRCKQLQKEAVDFQINQKKQIDRYRVLIMHHVFSNKFYEKNLGKLIKINVQN